MLRWGKDIVCPHCGVAGNATELQGRLSRQGIRKCRACRRQFSVVTGTVLEHTRLDMELWEHAIDVVCVQRSVKTGQHLASELGVNYRTAWLIVRRLRRAMPDLLRWKPASLEEATAAVLRAGIPPSPDRLELLDRAMRRGVTVQARTKRRQADAQRSGVH